MKNLAGIVVFGFFYSELAYAYLDPGTLTVTLQALIAAVVGSFFFLQNFWRRCVGAVVTIFKKAKK